MKRRLGVTGIAALVALGIALVPAFAANVTVGRFYMEIAQSKHLASVDPAMAQASLRSAGYDLPRLELTKGLTEGDMTLIAGRIGIPVTTQRPDQPVTETQLSTFMSAFGGQKGTVSTSPFQTNDGNGANNGKGLKKGHHKSTSEPG